MRSIWKGSLTFGLVNVPVNVYSATEDHDVRFHQVHKADGGRIRYQRICEKDGKQVEFADIGKAYEADDGRTVVLTDEDFEQLPVATGHEIEVLRFVPDDEIDPVLFDRSYYLEPSGSSVKAYVLLRSTLEQTDRVAVVHFALREKVRLAALRVRDGVLMVQTLLWPDEVRQADFAALDTDVAPTPAEVRAAAALVESFAGSFEPEEYSDEYREQLQQLIDAKLEGTEAFPDSGEDAADDAEVVDLLAALRRSVEAGQGGSGTGSTRSGTAKSTAGNTRSAKTGTATSTAAKSGSTKTGTAKSTAAKSSAAKTRSAKTGTKSSTATTGAPKSSAGRSSTKGKSTGKNTTGRSGTRRSAAS
ncbi:non-homologous end joining protein Ku [Nakamurella endophytica]|uniref:Non-homologous end joining protein Ku n=1 Tax=Nakamurella endophytica TaxID=1748367 RepID=A0A917WG14_9ACTN|nr:Ku protein [Nakamurella endophytica]GGM00816.1 hypothetical protein GCM10011594_21080 [Nakamurella endophytica]